MFALITQDQKLFTGRTGDAWLSHEKSEAFMYGSEAAAMSKAGNMNRNSSLHGQIFTVVEENDILTFFPNISY